MFKIYLKSGANSNKLNKMESVFSNSIKYEKE